MANLCLRSIRKSFGDLVIVPDLNLDIGDGELIVLVGPSGCGKSTILRMIAGLETTSGGTITMGEREVTDLQPKDRDVAMVFQDYALYPHMTVRQNIGFGLRMRRIDRIEFAKLIQQAAESLQIKQLLDRKPKQLSGGQRQRVAMGRAIVRKPSLFLFDEPLSNLDAKLRAHMRTQIKLLHRAIGTTSIYVTHDQVEAMTLADRIVVLKDGRIEQLGTPDELYQRPANRFVAGFLGSPTMNFIPGRVVDDGRESVVEIAGNRLQLPRDAKARLSGRAGNAIILGIRPEHISDAASASAHSSLDNLALALVDMKVEITEPLGSDTLVYGRLADTEVVARVAPGFVAAIGQPIKLTVQMNRVHFFDPDSGHAI